MLKKTIRNIIIIVLILLVVSNIIRYFMPFYWGDSTQTVKYEYYKKNAEDYNAVYLGGSLEQSMLWDLFKNQKKRTILKT